MNMDFYEKPGCINGEKQKTILRGAGHTLNCIDILSHPWTKELLLPFVAGKEPAAMVNHTAPSVKRGAIVPALLTFDEALSLMIAVPILIKRPLVRIGDLYLQGFNDPRLQPFLGGWDGREDVVTCPNLQTISCDEQNQR